MKVGFKKIDSLPKDIHLSRLASKFDGRIALLIVLMTDQRN
jgi:hypothetical protein